MRTFLRGKITLLFMTCAMLLAVPAVALADDVYNNLDSSIDAAAESITLTEGGSNDTASVLISPTNGDGKNGCNLTASSTLKVKAVSSDSAKVTASLVDPDNTSVAKDTFTSCGDSIKVKVEALAATGSTPVTITLEQVSNTTAGTFNLAPAAFTVTVNAAAPSCTNPADPTFSGTPNGDNGWYKTIPTVSATSTTSGAVIKYSDAANGTYSTTAPTLGQGTTTVYAKAFSSTGTCASAAVSNIYKVDTIAPEINDDGTTQTPNDALWFKAAVVNNFSASDATPGSGLASAASFTKSSGTDEGLAVNINSGPVSDNAGNTNPGIDSAAFKIDLTKPSVNVINVENGATYTTGDVPTPDCDTTDGLSGVKDSATVNVTGGTGGFGTFTATCSGAVDNADNPQDGPVSVTYGVKAAFDGFLQPIDGHSVNTGKYGRTYPIKWQLRDSSGALISDSAAQLLVATMTGGQKAVSCTSFDLTDTDALESSTTGGTSLRYDATSDQFIYNYKAPSSGTCYVFAIRNADGLTTQQIDFKFTK
jgi:hypothetical protein